MTDHHGLTKPGPLLLLLSCLIFTAATGCSVSDAQPRKEGGAGAKGKSSTSAATVVVPTASVQVAVAQARRFVESFTVQAFTVADSDLTYSAEVPGTVESLRLKPGQRVRRGQVLARIDYLSLKARAEAARARFKLQDKTHGRLVTLRKDDLVPQQTLDQAEAALVSARVTLRIATADLSKSVIRARRGGVVARKFVEGGEYVSPGTPVLQVVDLDRVIVQGQLPESQVAAVKVGAPVRVDLRALGKRYTGKVDAVIPVAAPVSRTFKFRVEVANPDHEILIGMAATVRLAVRTHEAAVMVPQDAVLEEAGARAVYIVGADDSALRRTVTLGATDGDRVMLTSGLSAGERLIVLGHRDLSPGRPVQVVN